MARQITEWRMPAEWEPHEATWLAWPHEKSDWPGKFAPIPWLYGEIVRQIAGVERVRINLSRPDLGNDLLDTKPSGDGGWVLNGNEVALPGAWHAEVIVRRTNIFDDARGVSQLPRNISIGPGPVAVPAKAL